VSEVLNEALPGDVRRDRGENLLLVALEAGCEPERGVARARACGSCPRVPRAHRPGSETVRAPCRTRRAHAWGAKTDIARIPWTGERSLIAVARVGMTGGSVIFTGHLLETGDDGVPLAPRGASRPPVGRCRRRVPRPSLGSTDRRPVRYLEPVRSLPLRDRRRDLLVRVPRGAPEIASVGLGDTTRMTVAHSPESLGVSSRLVACHSSPPPSRSSSADATCP
jgi:hypothetical protein